MSFSEFANKILYEEKVSSKLMKNAIDLINDYVYYVKADLSNDERKQIVDNLQVSVDGTSDTSIVLNGESEFVQNGKYNKKAVFSIELKFDGIQDIDASGADSIPLDADMDMGGEEGGEDVGGDSGDEELTDDDFDDAGDEEK